MSQDAYALFKTIKTIKGYTIMSLRNLTNASLVLQDSRLIKTGSNIAGSLATTNMHVHNIQTTAIPTADAYSALVKLGGSRYVKITPLLTRAGETVNSAANQCNIRITGWNYVTTIGWVPTTVYYQPIPNNTLTTTTFTIYGDALKGINALFPTATFGINNSTDSYWVASTTGSTLSPANLIVNTLGYQYLELEFPTTQGDSGNTRTNAIITEFN